MDPGVTQKSVAARFSKLAPAESTTLRVALPVDTTAATPISTNIAVAQTRRGARSRVVAPNAPGPPNNRAIAPAVRTIGPVAA